MSLVTVIVPLRLNSKSIPKKNIRPLAGKPMCGWVLEAAAQARGVGQVLVSTEAQEIIDVISALGLPVDFVRRPDELAGDKSTTEAVMLHALEACKYPTMMLIQATSPLLRAAEIDAALETYHAGDFDSLLSAIRTKAFFWSDENRPLNYDPLRRPMRQDFTGCLQENGALYVTTTAGLKSSGCRLNGRIGVFEMGPDTAVELDEPHDWLHVEQILKQRQAVPAAMHSSLANIKCVICDVDGTLTDGGMYYGSEGELLKKFNTRDAVGLAQLRERGIRIVIVTSEDSPAVAARMRKLQISDYHPGVKDKLRFVESFLAATGLSWSEVAYFGDDLNDISCMRRAAWVACPADACPEVQAIAHFRSIVQAGSGAVREACRALMSAAGQD